MPTSNINITTSWTKVADDTNQELLVSWNEPVSMEVALTSANGAPTVSGHTIAPGSAITRPILGAGFVWMRQIAAGGPATVPVVVTK